MSFSASSDRKALQLSKELEKAKEKILSLQKELKNNENHPKDEINIKKRLQPET